MFFGASGTLSGKINAIIAHFAKCYFIFSHLLKIKHFVKKN
jgi:hypothetical protein